MRPGPLTQNQKKKKVPRLRLPPCIHKPTLSHEDDGRQSSTYGTQMRPQPVGLGYPRPIICPGSDFRRPLPHGSFPPFSLVSQPARPFERGSALGGRDTPDEREMRSFQLGCRACKTIYSLGNVGQMRRARIRD